MVQTKIWNRLEGGLIPLPPDRYVYTVGLYFSMGIN